MQKNIFLGFSSLVYHIYNIADFREMETTVLSLAKSLIPYVCASFCHPLGSEENGRLHDPVCIPESYRQMELDYLAIEKYDYSRWILFNNRTQVIRETDLMPEADRIETVRYKTCYQPYGLHYSTDVILAQNNQLVGIMSLYRPKDMEDFNEEELFILNAIGDHLSSRFYREFGKTESAGETQDALRLAAAYGLTEREAEVLERVLQNRSNDEIAEELCVSLHTLKKHLQNLYRKTGVSGRYGLLTLKVSG